MGSLISTVVKDRTGVVFEDQVRAVSSWSDKGPFDVLPLHTNFITILRKRLILHKSDGTNQEISLDNGVMRVIKGQIEVYIGIK